MIFPIRLSNAIHVLFATPVYHVRQTRVVSYLLTHKAVLATFFVVIFLHTYKISTIPMGLYLDESSIGLNAATIEKYGIDEHGERWPIFFRAFGENKNPTYIYAASAMFRVFDTSLWSLRITSAVFFLCALFIFDLLLRSLFKQQHIVRVFALASFGTIPCFFVISRISFEVISQLTWVSAILFFAYLFFHARTSRTYYLFAIMCGALIGTSIYTYSTARLLAPVTLLCIALSVIRHRRISGNIIIYCSLSTISALSLMFVAFVIALIPYIIFSFDSPGGLTGRFYSISYIDDGISLSQKVMLFAKNYLGYWGPDFLLYNGDHNLRHATGYCGALYITIWLLGLIGVFTWIKRKLFVTDHFIRFFMLSWLCAPVAASFMDSLHILRSMTLGVYWIIAACYGLKYLSQAIQQTHRKNLTRVVFGLLLFESTLYMSHYFILFPEKSLQWSESFDALSTYQRAVALNPRRILFVAEPSPAYVTMRFNQHVFPTKIPVEIVNNSTVKPRVGDCVIYHIWSENHIRSQSVPIYSEAEALQPTVLQDALGIRPTQHFSRLKCF